MNVAIVGSRTFPQLQLVDWFVRDLPAGVTIISGGARGVDAAAADSAKKYGLAIREYLPNLTKCHTRPDFTEAYYARNQQIVEAADLVIAFTEKDRGGTWDTIKRARKLNRPVKVIRPSVFFDRGPQEPTTDDAQENTDPCIDEPEPPAAARTPSKGPFHLRRIGLGSFGLRARKYIPSTEWADYINEKDVAPRKCADRMLPAFLDFFRKNNLFGRIHCFTTAPRSIRHLDHDHPMDLVATALAKTLGIPYEPFFAPWDKKRRGRFAAHPKIEVLHNVKNWIGHVVYVLDDVTTTNFTLQACVRSLQALEIHTHGVAYIVYN